MRNDRGFQAILRPGEVETKDEDRLLEALAAKKGISRLQSPQETARATPSPSHPVKPSASTTPAQALPEPLPEDRHGPTPRSRSRSMNLELPDYVMRALKEAALDDDCSVRHVIMRALAKDGIPIQPSDMIADGRRLRGKNALT